MREIDFTYETVGGLNCLVASFPGGEGLINYQVQMLIGNDIRNIIKTSKKQKNNDVQIFYNITSMIPLMQAIGNRKISKENLISIIEGALAALADVEEYQLASSGILFESDKIFVEGNSFEPHFIYIPNSAEDIGIEKLKKLILGFIVESKVEISNDNFIQVLLEELNNPALTADALKKLCKKYKDGAHTKPQTEHREVPPRTEMRQAEHKPQPEPKPEPKQNREPPKKTEEAKQQQKPDKKQEKEKKQSAEKNPKKNLFMILQIVLIAALAAIYFTGILNDESGALNIQYLFGVVLALGAADFILYRELFANKKNEEKKEDKPEKKSEGKPARKSGIAIPGKEIPSGGAPKQEPKAKPEREYARPKPADDFGNEDTVVFEEENTVVMEDAGFGKAYLEFYENGLVTKIKLEKESTVVGKLRSQCDFAFNNNKISKIHAEFIMRNGEYYVKDCSSTNGTYINGGSRLASNAEYRIYNGDRITLANVDLTLKC